MISKVLPGSESFMKELVTYIETATKSVYIQAMTFEGDQAGEQLINALLASKAKDIRLLIDSFSKVVISDDFVFGPRYFLDEYFRKEIKNTKRLIQKARQAGIKVQYTNPVGPLLLKYPLRNHKKMMIIDEEISFVGGINFSDHNFSWHDMMVRLSDQEVSRYLAEDFRHTWVGKNQSEVISLQSATLFLFNGIKSKEGYKQLWEKILNARKTIQIISPYVSEPLLSVVSKAASQGVEVSIISPKENNKFLFKNLLLSEAGKGHFQLFHYNGMSHLKALLIDAEELVFGSSNYDMVSYYFEQEVVLSTRDASLVSEFRGKVLEEMLANAQMYTPKSGGKPFTHLLVSGLEFFL